MKTDGIRIKKMANDSWILSVEKVNYSTKNRKRVTSITCFELTTTDSSLISSLRCRGFNDLPRYDRVAKEVINMITQQGLKTKRPFVYSNESED